MVLVCLQEYNECTDVSASCGAEGEDPLQNLKTEEQCSLRTALVCACQSFPLSKRRDPACPAAAQRFSEQGEHFWKSLSSLLILQEVVNRWCVAPEAISCKNDPHSLRHRGKRHRLPSDGLLSITVTVLE